MAIFYSAVGQSRGVRVPRKVLITSPVEIVPGVVRMNEQQVLGRLALRDLSLFQYCFDLPTVFVFLQMLVYWHSVIQRIKIEPYDTCDTNS